MKRVLSLIIVFVLLCFPIKTNAVSVSAKAAVVINGDNGEIIFEKNAHTKLSMASTTKIMTGLLLCEYGNLEREITVTKEMVQVEGSSMGLLPGDKVTLHDLLYGLLLASGNDAANVIATVIGGTVDGFAKLMNERAGQMGLKNTSFVTPSGLDDENHYTTAYELALIAKEAMKNEAFAEAVSSKSAVLCYGNPPYRRRLTNHNKLLNYDNSFIGVKTGFTKKSGRCLVSARKEDGKYVICVTLCAPDDWNDHKALSSFAFSELKQVTFKPEREIEEIEVIGANEPLRVNLGSFFVNTTSNDAIEFKVNLPKFLYAPIKKGEEIGEIECIQNGKVCFNKKITAQNDVLADERYNSKANKFLIFARMIISEF